MGNRVRKQTESEAKLKARTLGIFLKEVGFGRYPTGWVGMRKWRKDVKGAGRRRQACAGVTLGPCLTA